MPRNKSQPVRNAGASVIDSLDSRRDLLAGLALSGQNSCNGIVPKKPRRGKVRKVKYDAEFEEVLKKSSFYLTIQLANEATRISLCSLGSFDVELDTPLNTEHIDEIKDCLVYMYISKWNEQCTVYYELNSQDNGLLSHYLKCAIVTSHANFSDVFFDSLNEKKTFKLTCDLESLRGQRRLRINIGLYKHAMTFYNSLNFVHTTPNYAARKVMAVLFDYKESPSFDSQEPPIHEISTIYETVKSKQNIDVEDFQNHPSMKPTLRKYQMEAVRWMLSRESDFSDEKKLHELFVEFTALDGSHLLYNQYGGSFMASTVMPLKAPTAKGGVLADEMGLGKTVEVLSLVLLHQKPSNDNANDSFKGETEPLCRRVCECICGRVNEKRKVLACASCSSLQHPKCINFDLEKHKRQKYFCAHCWERSETKLQSRATFIISPRSILDQWKSEIVKHVDSSGLKVFVYEGVSAGGCSYNYVQPYDLCDNDIVLASYETLRSELSFVDLPENSRLRHPKKFSATPTPLLSINWWRICLDEAQMVESATKAAEMALRLSAVNRWCITGTPIERSVNDLYGLFLFTGVDPVCHRTWWRTMIYEEYCRQNSAPLIELLTTYFWRSNKRQVWSQLEIPEQSEKVVSVQLGPVEKHFYDRQREKRYSEFMNRAMRFTDLNVTLKNIDKHAATLLMKPLITLRQACCHPQAVRGKSIGLAKKAMTMQDILKQMIKNTKYECEEEHRKIIASLHGKAAIFVIKKNHVEAVETYRTALNSIEENKKKGLFRTDKLQQLHALHNLAEVFQICGIRQKNRVEHDDESMEVPIEADEATVNIPRTLRDEYIKADAEEIKSEYLSKGVALIDQSKSALNEMLRFTDKVSEEADFDNLWFSNAITMIAKFDSQNRQSKSMASDLVDKIKESLAGHTMAGPTDKKAWTKFVSIADKFKDLNGLHFILVNFHDDLNSCREKLVAQVPKLSSMPADEDIHKAIDCHLRPRLDKDGNRIGKVVICRYCKVHEMFNAYEKKLFYFSQSEKIEEAQDKDSALIDDLRRGTWAISEAEEAMKLMLQTFNRMMDDTDRKAKIISEKGANYLKYLDSLKKEFRSLRTVWINIRDFVSQLDEINMATIRLRLRFPEEPKPDPPLPYILEEEDLNGNLIQLESDEKLARADLAVKLGHLHYLDNLQKAKFELSDGQNKESCPVCVSELGSHWNVFICGHCVCLMCMDYMIEKYTVGGGAHSTLKCPVCRTVNKLSEVYHVKADAPANEEAPRVAGSWSSKIEEVVRAVLDIQESDPNAKTLIFSSWTEILHILESALNANNIGHMALKTGKRYEAILKNFKSKEDIKVLLLPFSLGAKGLNLIEATHVFLIEPLLNPANELQAIGRVHRIGQTKPTFVHRFIVHKTIEERIYEMFSHKDDAQSANLSFNVSETDVVTLKDMLDLFSL